PHTAPPHAPRAPPPPAPPALPLHDALPTSDSGLGMYIVRSAHSFRTEQVFAGIVLISLYSVLLFKIVDWARHVILPWERYVTEQDRNSTRLNSSHVKLSYAVFCLKKKNTHE